MGIRLGINIDHVATLRNARGGTHPCPVRAAQDAVKGGADLITAHLREDRRHMRDADMPRLKHETGVPLNMEMAVTPAMLAIALDIRPYAVCLVPERRAELTTEGGLDVAGNLASVESCVKALQDAGIAVSLFVDAEERQLTSARKAGAGRIELHTGAYAASACMPELKRLQDASLHAARLGLRVHAGHGLDYGNVSAVAAIPEIEELNIGHFLVGEAVFTGFTHAVRHMKDALAKVRP